MFVPITFIQERHIKQNVSNIEDRGHGHYANCPLYHFDVNQVQDILINFASKIGCLRKQSTICKQKDGCINDGV